MTPPPGPPTSPETVLALFHAQRERCVLAAAFLELVPEREQRPCLSRLLARSGPVRVVPAGDLLTGPPHLLLGGLVEEWKGPFRLSVRQPGDIVGELGALVPSGGVLNPGTIRARDDAEVLPLDPASLTDTLDQHPGFTRALLRAVAHHGLDFADDEGQLHEALHEYFPEGVGQLVPGPFECPDVILHLFPFVRPASAAHVLNRTTPPGVAWCGDVFFLALVKLREVTQATIGAPFAYDEVTFFVPSRIRGHARPRMHVPFIFADNVMAIFLGREISGLPKLQVSTFIERDPSDADRWRGLIRRGDRSELDLSFRTAAPSLPSTGDLTRRLRGLFAAPTTTAAAALWDVFAASRLGPDWWRNAMLGLGLNEVRTTAWKRVFHPAASHPPGPGEQYQVDALCQASFHVSSIREVTPLELDLGRLRVADGFPLQGARPLSSRGLRLSLSMRMGGGPVLLDYRAEA